MSVQTLSTLHLFKVKSSLSDAYNPKKKVFSFYSALSLFGGFTLIFDICVAIFVPSRKTIIDDDLQPLS